MFVSSLATLALATSAAMPNLGTFLHMHPHTPLDTRVSVTLVNTSNMFRDVRIDGRTYTVTAHRTLSVRGPSGTAVYADSRSPMHRKGDVLVALTPALNNTSVTLN